jgi:hypothetical protein
MPTNGRWALLINNTTGPNLVRNNILYNRHAFRGAITYGSPADVANTDSDYNVLDRVSQDDGNTVLTLAQWKAQGHELHSFFASDTDLWVSAAGTDYHLKAGSPAIDQGPALADATRDREGHVRPWGVRSDLGADEAVAANFVTTPYVSGLSNPTAMQFAPDGRLFVFAVTGTPVVQYTQPLAPGVAYTVTSVNLSIDLNALQAADVILLVAQLELTSIRNCVRLINTLDHAEGLTDKIHLVMNRVGGEDQQISLAKAEATINRRVFWQLPNDAKSMLGSRNAGRPLISVMSSAIDTVT